MSIWTRIFGGPRDREVVRSKSPVAWVSDVVWSHWMDDPATPFRCPISEPKVMAATDSDRERARIARVSEGDMAPIAVFSSQESLLLGTPWANFGVFCPTWPVCCNRLATLFWDQGSGPLLQEIESSTGPLDKAYLEGETRTSPATARREYELALAKVLASIRLGHPKFDGILLFQCRACWRVYVASCEP
jgi:hypothetical protein